MALTTVCQSDSKPSRSHIHEADMEFFYRLAYELCGICFTGDKKQMLASRCLKRVKALGMAHVSEYSDYLRSLPKDHPEMCELIDLLTTHETRFFREPTHFQYLLENVIPEWRSRINRGRSMSFWSAGCSTGEEPYTLSMVLQDSFGVNPGLFSILATDIAQPTLSRAQKAVYSSAAVEHVSESYRKKYLMRGKGSMSNYWRVVPELRSRIRFRLFNLIESDYSEVGPMDAVFCRNVLIYFDQDTVRTILRQFHQVLCPGGLLFLGHSENVMGLNHLFEKVHSTVYRKKR